MRVFDAGNMFPGMTFDFGSIIGAGASLIGGAMSGSAASDAADAQAQANAAAIAEQRRQFNEIKSMNAPFLNTGSNAVGALGWLMGLGPENYNTGGGNAGAGTGDAAAATSTGGGNILSYPQWQASNGHASGGDRGSYYHYLNSMGINDINQYDAYRLGRGELSAGMASGGAGAGAGTGTGTGTGAAGSGSYSGYGGSGSFGSLTKPFGIEDFYTDPGYEWALQEGQRALQRTQTANGQLQSGAAAKAMNEYSQGVADQQYGAAYNRYNTDQGNLYNRMMGLTNVGQAAASMQASAGNNMAGNIGDYQTNIGNANAAGILGQSAGWSTGLNSIGNALGGFFGGGGGGQNVGQNSGFVYGPITWN